MLSLIFLEKYLFIFYFVTFDKRQSLKKYFSNKNSNESMMNDN